MTDYYGNQPPQNPQNPQYPSGPFPSQYPPSPPGGFMPPPSPPGGMPAQYPQSPPGGLPAQNPTAWSPSYYTSSQPALPEPAPKSRAKVVLIVVAVLMFAAAGVFAGLYVAAESDHDKATSVLEDKKAELTAVKGEITTAEEAKSAAEQTNSDLESQNSALTPCVEATQHYLWDVTDAPDAERQVALDAMFDACS
jgi:hypothetical protein